MGQNQCIEDSVVEELVSCLLSKDDKPQKEPRVASIIEADRMTAFSKLLVASFPWKGCSEGRKNEMFPFVFGTLHDGLHFYPMSQFKDELFHLLEIPDIYHIQFTEMYKLWLDLKDRLSDEHQNLCVALELLIYFVLSNSYDALARSFLIRATFKLDVKYTDFLAYERKLLGIISAVSMRLSKDNDKLQDHAKASGSKKKWLKVGLTATLAGALAVIAAPLLLPVAVQAAVGVAGIVGGAASTAIISTSAFLASSTGLTIWTAGFVAGGASYGGVKMARRLNSDVDMTIVDSETSMLDEEWSAVPETFDLLLVNGLVGNDYSVLKMWGLHPSYRWWRTDFDGGHVYYLDWENELLHRISSMVTDTVYQSAASSFLSSIANQLLLRGAFVMSPPLWAFVPLSFLDNVWSVAKNKADIAGKDIGQQLLERETNRPLSLVGMSVGCQVILSILDTLPPNSNIIQDVILMGCPFSTTVTKWSLWRQKNDGILAYVQRIESGSISVAGLTGVNVDGIESYDVSDKIHSHFDYIRQIRAILSDLHFNSAFDTIYIPAIPEFISNSFTRTEDLRIHHAHCHLDLIPEADKYAPKDQT